MLSSAHLFTNGTFVTIAWDAASPHAGPARSAGCIGWPADFAQLVSVYQSNESLSAQLKAADQNLARARTYLETPGSNPALAGARLQRIKARRSAVLTLLRANRHRARILLARAETGAKADVA